GRLNPGKRSCEGATAPTPVARLPAGKGEPMPKASATVAVVGLGYVGLPLAVAFGKKYPTIGFDLSTQKIEAYRRIVDPTGEVASEDLAAARLTLVSDPAALREADFVVVAVPTPVDEAHIPDFGPLAGASTTVGQNL